MSIALSPIRAVLFDLDGTLVHSSLDFNRMRQDISCPAEYDILSYLDTLSSGDRLQAEEIIRQHEMEDAKAAALIPGSVELLNKLAEDNIKTAIITRNSRQATHLKLKQLALPDKFVLTREDAPAKPDPSGLLYFSRLWCLEPRSCVYVGDYKYDLQAARNANMHAGLFCSDASISLPDYAHEADFIFNSFDSFENELLCYLSKDASLRE